MDALQMTTVIVQFSYTSVSFLDTDFTRLQRYDVDVEIFPIFGAIFGMCSLSSPRGTKRTR
jgi:hypothetical protein